MPLLFKRREITTMKVDAIVNAANNQLAYGGGVCGAIFEAAGVEKLQATCNDLKPIKTGEAVITPGFNLQANFIIHTCGPVYAEHSPKEAEELLRNCYLNSLILAKENHCQSIAFPLISSGIYGYPILDSLSIAIDAISSYLASEDLDVYLVFYDKKSFEIGKELKLDIDDYLSKNFEDIRPIRRYSNESSRNSFYVLNAKKASSSVSPNEAFDLLDEPFSTTLLKLIDSKHLTDPQVYKKANIDRKLFSKLRNEDYSPSKKTVIALAIALQLALPETEALLKQAGYALSHSQKFDVIIEYFILRKEYDIYKINEVLFSYDLPLLGN